MIGDIVSSLEYAEKKYEKTVENKNFKKVIKFLQRGEKQFNIFEIQEDTKIDILLILDILNELELRGIIKNLQYDGASRYELGYIIDEKILSLIK